MSDKKAFILRINPQILKDLQKWADDEFRSVNGQIEFLLHTALLEAKRTKSVDKKSDPKKKS